MQVDYSNPYNNPPESVVKTEIVKEKPKLDPFEVVYSLALKDRMKFVRLFLQYFDAVQNLLYDEKGFDKMKEDLKDMPKVAEYLRSFLMKQHLNFADHYKFIKTIDANANNMGLFINHYQKKYKILPYGNEVKENFMNKIDFGDKEKALKDLESFEKKE